MNLPKKLTPQLRLEIYKKCLQKLESREPFEGLCIELPSIWTGVDGNVFTFYMDDEGGYFSFASTDYYFPEFGEIYKKVIGNLPDGEGRRFSWRKETLLFCIAELEEKLGRSNDKVTYVVTGVLKNGRRFKPMEYSSLSSALCINLWRGSVWEVKNGKRKRIKSVYN